jgi:hypothetical protein
VTSAEPQAAEHFARTPWDKTRSFPWVSRGHRCDRNTPSPHRPPLELRADPRPIAPETYRQEHRANDP